MGIEIERKFLVDLQQWRQLEKPTGSNYRQGYIVKDELKTVRIRTTDNGCYITIKGKTNGVSRSEYEYEIPKPDADELLAGFCNQVITKTRYRIDFAGKVWEVDVFSGDNDGLVMAEIELDSEDEKFESPKWIGQEVTGDVRYYNSSLSLYPYSTW